MQFEQKIVALSVRGWSLRPSAYNANMNSPGQIDHWKLKSSLRLAENKTIIRRQPMFPIYFVFFTPRQSVTRVRTDHFIDILTHGKFSLSNFSQSSTAVLAKPPVNLNSDLRP